MGREAVNVLGICAAGRPAAACLVRDGRVVGAVREDVFSGRLGDPSFPSQAIAYCLRSGKIGPGAVDLVAIAAPLDARVPEAAYPDAGRPVSSFAKRLGRWLGRQPTLRDLLRDELGAHVRVECVDAVLAEASAAYWSSPFPESAILVMGDTATTRWLGRDGTVTALGAFDGDVAAGAARMLDETGVAALCVAGSGALDRARNARLRADSGFDRFWVGPAPGAEAAALGAAITAGRPANGAAASPDPAGESRLATGLGPAYNAAQIRTFLRSQGVSLQESGRDEAAEIAATLVAEGQRVGWLDGRLDIGEETAGSRAMLRAPSPSAPPDPMSGEVLAVAADRVADLFEVEAPCPSWLELPLSASWRAALGDARDREQPLPFAPVAAEHRGFRAMLTAFESKTGLPAVIARPLRLAGRPIACAPGDAWAVREAGAVDALVMGPYVLAERPLTEGVGTREIGAFPPSPSRTP